METSTTDHAASILAERWSDLDGPPALLDHVTFTGPGGVLASPFDVTGFAAATVAAAALGVAELAAARAGTPVPGVAVDRSSASAAFRFERLVEPRGWELPPIWDPVAGDYRTADGWIRLHTNYAHHLRAVLAVIGTPADRDAVAAAVAGWDADDLEDAVVGAGGCAAVMRSPRAWADHAAGRAAAAERPVVLGPARGVDRARGNLGPIGLGDQAGRGLPLDGVRVLDVTRVIAGPVATRYLAGYGADVLRIDPPGFVEVGALLPETTAGKRCAALDLADRGDRARFESLVADAHVVVGGLRPDALGRLGLGPGDLRAINPAVITVHHDAYGWSGPWAGRRGFDSLVQMSTGIAWRGAEAAGVESPRPLPVQALDHGLGHLLAAATCRALTRLVATGAPSDVRGSLVGAANVLAASPGVEHRGGGSNGVARVPLYEASTAWGPMWRVPLAGVIHGVEPVFAHDAGPLGRHRPAFTGGA